MKKLWIVAGGAVLALGAVLFALHPLGPLFLLFSLLVQAPLVWGLSRRNFQKSYRQRAAARQAQYRQTGDAHAWLAGERAEAASPGFRYWSGAGRALCALNQADALASLGRRTECANLLNTLDTAKLDGAGLERYRALSARLEENAE